MTVTPPTYMTALTNIAEGAAFWRIILACAPDGSSSQDYERALADFCARIYNIQQSAICSRYKRGDHRHAEHRGAMDQLPIHPPALPRRNTIPVHITSAPCYITAIASAITVVKQLLRALAQVFMASFAQAPPRHSPLLCLRAFTPARGYHLSALPHFGRRRCIRICMALVRER